MTENIQSYMNIVNTHTKRLQFALDGLSQYVPFTDELISNMSDIQFMYFEVLTNRFSKLQDYLGNKIFDLVLERYKEDIQGMSMIDKLNRLEKIGIIDSAEFWDQLRDLRNHLTHEYPDHPELTAKYLNKTFSLSTPLINLATKMVSVL